MAASDYLSAHRTEHPLTTSVSCCRVDACQRYVRSVRRNNSATTSSTSTLAAQIPAIQSNFFDSFAGGASGGGGVMAGHFKAGSFMRDTHRP